MSHYFNECKDKETIMDKPYEDILNCLLLDTEFNELFEYFRIHSKINNNLGDINSELQVDILSKAYFILKSQNVDLIHKNFSLNKNIEDLTEKYNHNILHKSNEKRLSSYEMKCEMEHMRLIMEKERKEIENIKNECINKKEKYKNKNNYLKQLIQDKENYIDNLIKRISDFNLNMKYKDDQISKLKIEKIELENSNEILNLKNEELNGKFEKLFQNYSEILEINKKIDEKWGNELSDDFNQIQEGFNLDELSIIDGNDNSIYNEKPEQVTFIMKINRKKTSQLYGTHKDSLKRIVPLSCDFLNNYKSDSLIKSTIFSELDKKTEENIYSFNEVNTIDSYLTDKNYESLGNRESNKSLKSFNFNESNCKDRSNIDIFINNSNFSFKFN